MKEKNTNSKSASKSYGRIYTPAYIVDIILDYVGYDSDILNKHIIDNSCGDGAFLTIIVERYCKAFFKQSSDLNLLKSELETYIHGIEIDETETQKCKDNLDSITNKFRLNEVNWDVIQGDTLTVDKYNGMMDFVVGNPPYVRVHNLNDSYDAVKEYAFAQGGMTDLFIVFFEIGFRMMNKNGKMSIITPSSWLSSVAGAVLRKHIKLYHNLSGCIDLGHFQAFENATTYTLISRFDNIYNESIDYKTFDGELHQKEELKYSDFYLLDKMYLSEISKLNLLRDILTSDAPEKVKVKNGFATLADKVFIGNFDFNEYVIPIIKASTGKWSKCIFPYDEIGKPLQEYIISESATYKHLLVNKELLTKGRANERGNFWYCFGRSQAIADVYKMKYSINSVIKNKESIKLNEVGIGSGVYSGLYILTDVLYNVLHEIIVSDDFIEYIKALKNYKSGGYYTFSSKDLATFINYKLKDYDE